MHIEKGSEYLMAVAYLKDVSALLALVSAVREGDFERHLQYEREMLRDCFAFDHINYARYLSYQHIFLRDRVIREFGGSLSGHAFSTIHGDLISEDFSGETKRNAGPCIAGYSTDVEEAHAWIKTSHNHTKMQNVLKEKINVVTSALHKELMPAAKRFRRNHLKCLKEKLRGYNINPFADVPARHTVTNSELDPKNVEDLLSAPEFRDERYKLFLEERQVEGTVDFYKPIKNLFLATGIEKRHRHRKKSQCRSNMGKHLELGW